MKIVETQDRGFTLPEKTLRSFSRIDAMSPELRACVHEFGEPIVSACLQAGVRRPNVIRQLVREIWAGARQLLQRQPTLGSLDWILTQAGAQISAKTLVRILRDNGHYIVPLDPTAPMVEASMAEVSNFDVRCTKRDKHQRRLRAAIKAGVKHLWPDLE
jgi:hypothetical protein